MAVFITSDLHIGHDRDFLYSPRGFNNIYEHDLELVKNWNSRITDDDTVYILGDIMLNDVEYGRNIFNQLAGSKIIILGNHDTDAKINFYPQLRGVIDVKYADMLRVGKRHFYLSHYPMCIGCRKYLYNLCGHVHTKDKWLNWDDNQCYHVELDAHNMSPISINEIIEDIKIKLQTITKEER